ncbi:unnamed protein product [Caenorhabditis sp. 36 PRJEB53466]|nr:unnamed protein product [Caenorhabditis sp. 36 PRJEB53466]
MQTFEEWEKQEDREFEKYKKKVCKMATELQRFPNRQELFEHVEQRLRMGYVDNCADIILEVTMPRVLEDWARLDYKGGERKTNEMYLNICKQISKKYKSSDFPDCSIKLLGSFYKSIEASARDHFSPKIFHFLAAWTLTSTSTAHVVESLNVLTGLNFEVLLVDRDSFRPALSSLVIGCLQKDDSKLTDPIFRLLSKIVTALQPGCEFWVLGDIVNYLIGDQNFPHLEKTLALHLQANRGLFYLSDDLFSSLQKNINERNSEGSSLLAARLLIKIKFGNDHPTDSWYLNYDGSLVTRDVRPEWEISRKELKQFEKAFPLFLLDGSDLVFEATEWDSKSILVLFNMMAAKRRCANITLLRTRSIEFCEERFCAPIQPAMFAVFFIRRMMNFLNHHWNGCEYSYLHHTNKDYIHATEYEKRFPRALEFTKKTLYNFYYVAVPEHFHFGGTEVLPYLEPLVEVLVQALEGGHRTDMQLILSHEASVCLRGLFMFSPKLGMKLSVALMRCDYSLNFLGTTKDNETNEIKRRWKRERDEDAKHLRFSCTTKYMNMVFRSGAFKCSKDKFLQMEKGLFLIKAGNLYDLPEALEYVATAHFFLSIPRLDQWYRRDFPFL